MRCFSNHRTATAAAPGPTAAITPTVANNCHTVWTHDAAIMPRVERRERDARHEAGTEPVRHAPDDGPDGATQQQRQRRDRRQRRPIPAELRLQRLDEDPEGRAHTG